MKKIICNIFISFALIFLIIPNQSKNDNLTHQNANYKTNHSNSVSKIAMSSVKNNKITWKEAKNAQLSLNGYTMVFEIAYISFVTLDSSYCSIYFHTSTSDSLVIDIEASNYPTYTFTNRYEQNTFASIKSTNGGIVKYVLPEGVTSIEETSFTKTSQAFDYYDSDDDLLNDFIYFLAPVIYPSVTFSYKVLPEEANNKKVLISLSWSDNTIKDDINEFISYIHDNINYKITVNCLKKANHQGKLTITSIDNNSISNYVTIDFEQEFLGFEKDVHYLYNTLYLKDNEKIFNEEDIKKEIINNSQGFIGNIATKSKEITNFTMKLNSAKIILQNSNSSSTSYTNSLDNEVYINARNNELSTDFINEIGIKYISLATNSLKQKIKDCETVTFQGSYEIRFDYYGSSYVMIAVFYDSIPSALLADYTYVSVSSIEVSNNITF